MVEAGDGPLTGGLAKLVNILRAMRRKFVTVTEGEKENP